MSIGRHQLRCRSALMVHHLVRLGAGMPNLYFKSAVVKDGCWCGTDDRTTAQYWVSARSTLFPLVMGDAKATEASIRVKSWKIMFVVIKRSRKGRMGI